MFVENNTLDACSFVKLLKQIRGQFQKCRRIAQTIVRFRWQLFGGPIRLFAQPWWEDVVRLSDPDRQPVWQILTDIPFRQRQIIDLTKLVQDELACDLVGKFLYSQIKHHPNSFCKGNDSIRKSPKVKSSSKQ